MSAVIPERFWAKVDQTSGDCWLWTGAKRNCGYGNFWTKEGGFKGAHRFAYETLVGPVPDGMELDHLCRVPRCVNPAHLEPVTHVENMRRGAVGYGIRTRCKSGQHDITLPENVYIARSNGTRQCFPCRRAAWRAKDERKRAARLASGVTS